MNAAVVVGLIAGGAGIGFAVGHLVADLRAWRAGWRDCALWLARHPDEDVQAFVKMYRRGDGYYQRRR